MAEYRPNFYTESGIKMHPVGVLKKLDIEKEIQETQRNNSKLNGNDNQNIQSKSYKSNHKTEAVSYGAVLEQLEQTNPSASETDKIKHLNDETSPKFQRKAHAALKAADNAAIDEFLQHPYAKVGKAAYMGWTDS